MGFLVLAANLLTVVSATDNLHFINFKVVWVQNHNILIDVTPVVFWNVLVSFTRFTYVAVKLGRVSAAVTRQS